jgi:hypothetical protein
VGFVACENKAIRMLWAMLCEYCTRKTLCDWSNAKVWVQLRVVVESKRMIGEQSQKLKWTYMTADQPIKPNRKF